MENNHLNDVSCQHKTADYWAGDNLRDENQQLHRPSGCKCKHTIKVPGLNCANKQIKHCKLEKTTTTQLYKRDNTVNHI